MTPKHAFKPGFANNDLQLNPYDVNPIIEDTIGQGISYLLGWHETSDSWKSVLVDTDGRVLVSTSPTQTETATNSAANVTNVSSNILAANDSRKQYIIQNLGTVPIYLKFGTPAVVASGFQLPVNGIFVDDVYTGVVSAITASGSSDVRIVEM